MGIRKRVSTLLLAVLLSFGVCAVDYLKVDALEVGSSVVWDTAINYLLGLLGLSPIAENGDKIVDFDSMRSKWVQDYEAYFYANVQPEDLPEGYTKERAYQNWIDNVCRGNLNTVEYGAWDIFKEWAETLPSENSGGSSGSDYNSIRSILAHYGLDNYSVCVNTSGITINTTIDILSGIMIYQDKSIVNFTLVYSPWTLNRTNIGNQVGYEFCEIYGYNFVNVSFDYSTNRLYLGGAYNSTGSFDLYKRTYPDSSRFLFNRDFFKEIVSDSSYALSRIDAMGDWDIFSGSVSGVSDYAVVNDKITDLQIINDYSTTTTQNVVSLDWDKIGSMISDAVGTVTGSLDRTITDALDDAQEKVAAGTMTVANYNDYVTEISNTYVYDITNETSITNPDSTVTGVVSGNVENAEFVLNGLQYVFPFCIPWDIKDFVTLLVADPVAPVIEYPIYNPVTDTDEIITIDFSLWENQVRIIRYIFDFLLIIGLLLLARSLIGAGGSD